MKKLAFLLIVLFLAYTIAKEQGVSIPGFSFWPSQAESTLQRAFNKRESNVQVLGEGVVSKVLPDDLTGSRHQKFLVKLSSGQTLLIDHNIDLAPRVKNLRTNDTVEFYGEYVWNEKGGVIHWTHHDPKGHRTDGWLKHNGRLYQ